MQLIVAPLAYDDHGPAVANLHDALGTLLRAGRIAVPSAGLRALLDDLARVGGDQVYGPPARTAVAAFQTQYRATYSIRQTDGTRVDQQTAAGLTSLLDVEGALDDPRRPARIVRGQVEFEDGTPAAGYQIAAFDRDIGARRTLLGSPERRYVTNDVGVFPDVRYTLASISEGEGARGAGADVVFTARPVQGRAETNIVAIFRRFRDDSGGVTERPVQDVQVGIQAGPLEEVRIVLAGAPSREGRSEYALLLADLRPLMRERQTPADFDQEQHRDITLAARESGRSPFLIATMVRAWQLAREASRSPQELAETFYGLLRDGDPTTVPPLPDTLAVLLQYDAAWRAKLDDSLSHQIIGGRREEHLARLVALQADQQVASPGEGRADLGDLLHLAGIPPAEQHDFLALYASQDGVITDFWQSVVPQRLGWDADRVKAVQDALQLGDLTAYHLPLAQQLHDQGLTTPRLVASLEPSALTAMVERVGPHPDARGETVADRVTSTVESILAQLEVAYPTQVMARIAATAEDPDLRASRPLLRAFFEREAGTDDQADGFDIRDVPVSRYLEEHAARIFEGIEEPAREQASGQLKRLQRAFQLSGSAASAQVLLEQRLDSAAAILRSSAEHFVARFGDKLGGEEAARQIYARAEHIDGTLAMLHADLWKALRDVQPAVVRGADRPSDPATALPNLKELPSYADMFGTLTMCDCSACQSIYSPAAYFVDLLHMLDQPGPGGKNPVQTLFQRRPDLEYIQLTCENTNTLIPYTDLVAEVLESYVANRATVAFNQPPAPPDERLPSPSEAELRVNPIPLTLNSAMFAQQAYTVLQESPFPLTLPLNLPLETVRVYLAHLGISRTDLMQLLDVDDSFEAMQALVAEVLGLGPEEYELAASANFAGGNPDHPATFAEYFGLSEANTPTENSRTLFNHIAPEFELSATNPDRRRALIKPLQSFLNLRGATPAVPLTGRYDLAMQTAVNTMLLALGLPQNGKVDAAFWGALETGGQFSVAVLLGNVRMLLDRTGLTFEELVELVTTRFMNPGLQGEGDLDFLARLDIPAGEVSAWIAGGLGPVPASIAAKLMAASQNVADFTRWVDNRRKMVVINAPPQATCDPEQMTVMHLDGTLLTLQELKALFQWVRLYRKLGWSTAELDLVVQPGGLTSSSSVTTLTVLANVVLLRQALELSVAEIVSLWSLIPTHGPSPLYDRLFRNRAAQLLDPVLALDADRAELAAVTSGPTPPNISDHVASILAAFRLTAADLALLRDRTDLADTPTTFAPLTLETLSRLHRHVVLARALRLPVGDLLKLLDLTEIVPFVEPTLRPPVATATLATIAATVREIGVTPSQLDYLVRDVSRPPSVPDPRQQTWRTLLGILTLGLGAIARDNQLGDDPDGTLLAQRLTAVLGEEDALAIARIAHGRDTYVAPLPGLTALPTFPASLRARVRYDTTTTVPALRVDGALTDADLLDLQAVTVAPPTAQPAYLAVLAALHAEPRALVPTALEAMLSGTDALTLLLGTSSLAADGSPDTTAVTAKVTGLLDRLRDLLSRAFVRQTLATATGLSAEVVTLMLEDEQVLTAQGVAGPAMADYLDLAGDGLAGDYFANVTLSGTSVQRTDGTLAFDWDAAAPAAGIPADLFSVRWSGWLQAPTTGVVTLAVRADDGVRLRLDGTLLVDRWVLQPATTYKTDVRLEAGRFYAIEIEYFEQTGGATLELRWNSPALAEAIVPQAALYTPTRLTALERRIARLFKLAQLLDPFTLSAREVKALVARGDLLLDAVPPVGSSTASPATLFRQWLGLADYRGLRDAWPSSDVAMIDVLDAATPADATDRFLHLSGWGPTMLAELIDGFTVPRFEPSDGSWSEVAPDLTRLSTWVQIVAGGRLARRTGAAPRQLFAWARSREIQQLATGPRTLWYSWLARDADGNDRSPENGQRAQDVKDVVRARYEDEEWREVAASLNDTLRERRRAALVAYALATPQLLEANITSANRLFEYFLIDVEMQPCMQTSRIKQGISSVQTFVQRCLLNLESPAVLPTDIDRGRWEWTKNYRVWEANRTIFLYPENWIEPELRDDKSPFFEELEAELYHSELTDESAEVAVHHYLEKLDAVARPAICNLLADPDGQTLHILGRTVNAPYTYYYRRLEKRGARAWDDAVWTPWETVPLDIRPIEDDMLSGVHVQPIVWNRRLHLFWPLFEPKSRQDIDSSDDFPKPVDWQIKLAWSEYRDGRWSPRHTSTSAVISPPLELNMRIQTDDARKLTPHVANVIIITTRRGFWEGVGAGIGWIPGGPGGAAVGASAAAALDDGDTTVEHKSYEEPTVITNTPLLNGVLLEPGDWASYRIVDDTETRLLLASRPGDHFFDAVVDQDQLTIRVFARFAGAPTGKTRHKVHTETVVVKKGTRTDRRDDTVTDAPETGSQQHVHYKIGDFVLPACGSEMTATSAFSFLGYNGLKRVPDTSNSYMAFRGHFPSPAGLVLIAGEDAVLRSPMAPFEIVDSDHLVGFSRSLPFTYQDERRSYLVLWQRLLSPVISVEHSALKVGMLVSAAGKYMELQAGQQQAIAPGADRAIGSNPWISSAAVRWSAGPAVATAMRVIVTPQVGPPPSQVNAEQTYLIPALDGSHHWLAPQPDSGYQFVANWHPYVCNFVAALNQHGMPGLLTPAMQSLTDVKPPAPNIFTSAYDPNPYMVLKPYPDQIVDFRRNGSYSIYNWELFFHVPMLIATRLSASQKFEEANRWFNYIMDPTLRTDADPGQVWRFLPFRSADLSRIDQIIEALGYTGKDATILARRQEAIAAVQEWLQAPFRPHLIARRRHSAYMKHVLMRYLDNLIAWADQLFRRDTMESINEAIQLYVMAANLLGERPDMIPAVGTTKPETYHSLRTHLDVLSNAAVDLETRLPFTQIVGSPPAGVSAVSAIPRTPYFCVPQNGKMLAYWDVVADRLFKIRHCMNIDGVERQLPLFEPPIDPALLVQAVAQGIDIASVLNDLYAPLPRYRFTYMLEKAKELANEVRALGAALLGAREKGDAEEMARLRAGQETHLLQQMLQSKRMAAEEAEETLQSLLNSARVIQGRIDYYDNLLTQGLIPEERDQLKNLDLSQERQETGSWIEATAQALNLVPNVSVGTGTSVSFGGSNLGAAVSAVARSYSYLSGSYAYKANRASIVGIENRREQEWRFQLEASRRELAQVERQIAATRLQKEIAQLGVQDHETQIEQAQAVEDLLRSRFANQELYAWMDGVISRVYFQSYQLAFDLAKRAERCYRYERGLTTSNFVQFGSWDSARAGLLAGEMLALQLKQMELSYLERDEREYEITRHISLQQLDPLALIALKENGVCEIEIPEWLHDLDFPGHYFRRIRSVGISLPCTVGPYTSVSATLTLLESKVRESGRVVGAYADDANYRTDSRAVEAIATSSGQNDHGLFELQFGDPRYLPCEGAGAISKWRLLFPQKLRQFDYDALADVILHIRYTSRSDPRLAPRAIKDIEDRLEAVSGDGGSLFRLFSLRHEMPNEWHQLRTSSTRTATFSLGKDRFPLLVQPGQVAVDRVTYALILKEPRPTATFKLTVTPPGGAAQDIEIQGETGRRYLSRSQTVSVPVSASAAQAGWQIQFSSPLSDADLANIKEILLVSRYTVTF